MAEFPGLAGLFLSAVTSATLLPGSSEAVVFLLLTEGYPWVSCLVVATIGNWLGGMTSYALGRLGRWSWLEKCGVREREVQRLQKRIRRWGGLAGLLVWVPVVGDVIMVGLGYFRLNVLAVAGYTLAGRLLRYGVVVYLAGFMIR